MATSEGLATEIHAETGLNGHGKELSGRVLGKHRLFAGGSRNLPFTSWAKPEESVKNLSQRWAHAIFVLNCINHMFGSERIEQVPAIKSVLLATLESYPPKIRIRVIGEAPTGGWNPQGRLSEYTYFTPPVDGIYEFDFVTESPDPTAIVPQVTTEVSAFFVIDSIPPGFAGVKIYGSGNSMVAS